MSVVCYSKPSVLMSSRLCSRSKIKRRAVKSPTRVYLHKLSSGNSTSSSMSYYHPEFFIPALPCHLAFLWLSYGDDPSCPCGGSGCVPPAP